MPEGEPEVPFHKGSPVPSAWQIGVYDLVQASMVTLTGRLTESAGATRETLKSANYYSQSGPRRNEPESLPRANAPVVRIPGELASMPEGHASAWKQPGIPAGEPDATWQKSHTRL